MVTPQQCETHVTPEDQTGPFTFPGHRVHGAEQCLAVPSPYPSASCLTPKIMLEEKGK